MSRVVRDRQGETISPEAWDAFVATSPDGHLLQTTRWGALKERFGWGVERVALLDGDTLVAGAQVLYRSLPGRLLSLAYVPMGPVVDWEDEAASRALLGGIRDASRMQRAFCIKIEPNRAESPALAARLARYGLRPSAQTLQPRTTICIDLRGTEEEVLARMHSKTRYNIRLAARRGVVVRPAQPDDLPAFERLVIETGERDAFTVHSPEYYRAAYDLFVAGGGAQLLLAEYEGALLAGVMVFAVGRMAWYLYGASGNSQRNMMPNYLLQWEAMRWARARGCCLYDLWGIPDEPDEALEREFTVRSDGLWGVYRFKRGFGGQITRWAGAHDRVCMTPVYWAYDRIAAGLERRWGETWHRHLRSG